MYPQESNNKIEDILDIEVEELEREFDMPRISNEILVRQNGQVYIYEGMLYSFEFKDLQLWAKANISKYVKRIERTAKKEIVQFWPPVRDTRYVDNVIRNTIWDYPESYSETKLLIVADNKIKTSRKQRPLYQIDLIDKAANSKRGLSWKLMDLVFSPIEDQVLQMYRNAMAFSIEK